MNWPSPRPRQHRVRPRSIAAMALLVASMVSHLALAQTPIDTFEQHAGTRAMTLDEALAFARAHHPRMQADQARVAQARAEAQIPRAQWLPTIGATAQVIAGTVNNSTASYVGSASVDLVRIGATRARDGSTANWAPSVSTLAAVGANQEVFDFGRIAAQSAAADAAIEVERHRADNAWLSIQLAVREGYYAVLAARAVVRAAEDAVVRATAHRDLARAWVAQGMRPRIELDRAEADLARFEVGRIRAFGGLAAARAVFAGAVGLTDTQLDAAGDLSNISPLPSLADAIRQAGSHDPFVLEMLSRLRAQEARTRAITAEALPDVSLTAALSGRAGSATPTSGDQASLDGFVPLIPNWNVGLVFNWNIFDGTVWARRSASRRAEDVARADVSVARQAQSAAIQEAWGGVLVAQSALPALARSLLAAQENYAQADARFRAGLGTSVELADAEALRTEAEIQSALGRFEVARARSLFARVISEGQ